MVNRCRGNCGINNGMDELRGDSAGNRAKVNHLHVAMGLKPVDMK
jgi:hypothetical protein